MGFNSAFKGLKPTLKGACRFERPFIFRKFALKLFITPWTFDLGVYLVLQSHFHPDCNVCIRSYGGMTTVSALLRITSNALVWTRVYGEKSSEVWHDPIQNSHQAISHIHTRLFQFYSSATHRRFYLTEVRLSIPNLLFCDVQQLQLSAFCFILKGVRGECNRK